jgi:tetratricopeptide (TPR) repeat protein
MTLRGWTAGFLSSESDPKILDLLRERGDPILLVLDYGDTRTGLHELLARLEAPSETAPPTRVLILARHRKTWRRWVNEAGTYLPLDETSLGPLAVTWEERRATYAEAVTAFSDRLGVPVTNQEEHLPELGTQPVLVLHMFALLRADSGSPVQISQHSIDGDYELRRSIVDKILARECRYWRRSAATTGLDMDDELLRRVVMVVALMGVDEEMEAAQSLRSIPDLTGASSERVHALARWALTLVPADADYRPEILQPDLILEQLVTNTVIDCPAILDSLLETSDFSERAWLVFDRACSGDRRLMDIFMRSVRANPTHAIRMLTPIAERSSGPLLRALLEASGTVDADPEVLQELADSISESSILIQEAAISLLKRAVEKSHGRGDLVHSKLLIRLARRLRKIGRGREAAQVGTVMLEITLKMAKSRNNPTNFEFAMHLISASKLLSDGEQYEIALSAARQAKYITDRMTEDTPENLLARAAVLKTLTTLYISLGRGDEVREFATEEWKLFVKIPDIDDLTARAALVRRMQGRISILRRYIDTESIVQTLSTMHLTRMEAAALAANPNIEWLGAQRSLAIMLNVVGLYERSMNVIHEVESVCRPLIDENLVIYGPELCQTLRVKCSISGGSNPEELIETRKEIVSLSRDILNLNPTPDGRSTLAGALIMLGEDLGAAGYANGSVTTTEEAVAIRRELAEEQHGTRWRELASALANLSDRQLHAQSQHLALLADAERLSVLQRLAASDFRRYGRDLYGGYINSTQIYARAGLTSRARKSALKSIAIARRIYQQDSENVAATPGAGSHLSKALAGAGMSLAISGMHEDALPLLTEAVDMRRTLVVNSSDERAAGLLRALGYLADALALAGRWEEALPLADEAFAMSAQALLEFPEDRSLSSSRKTDTGQFYTSLVRLNGILNKLGNLDAATRIKGEGAEIMKILAASGNITAQRLQSHYLPNYNPHKELRTPGAR